MKIFLETCPSRPAKARVRELFAQHGTVESVSLITDRDTGQLRSFGFVEMPRADGTRAIESLNGKALGGRPLRVNEAQDSKSAPRGSRRW
jgi:RNA recognition motif-containing protein